MRRNDIVSYNGDGEFFVPYGRINRMFTDGTAEVIDCGRFVRRLSVSDLTLHNDYKGRTEEILDWEVARKADYRIDPPVKCVRLIRMPTLRRLKQMSAGYHPEVWKKNRKKNHECKD